MVNFDVRVHPGVMFAYSQNFVELIINAANEGGESRWCEANIHVPEKLSLSPDNALRKARMRVGIIEKDARLEKNLRIYAGELTNPQMYRCKITLYTYDKNGVVDMRLEKGIDIRCEVKKPDVL
jgi:hypothetical protein